MKHKTWKNEALELEGLKSDEAVPMYGGSLCREEFLYFLHSFQDFVESHDLTIGKHYFGTFRAQLYGPAKQRWDTLIEGNAKSSIDDFKRFRLSWTCEMFDTTDYDSQVHYLMEVKKPRDMSVEKFVARIQTIALLMRYMPRETGDENEVLTERTLKRIIYFACPQTWRQKFEDLDKTVTAPLPTIIRHMKRQEVFSARFNFKSNTTHHDRTPPSGTRDDNEANEDDSSESANLHGPRSTTGNNERRSTKITGRHALSGPPGVQAHVG